MAHLTLAGVSEDGRRLLLVSDAGVEFTLDLDSRLRAALRGETARLGQLEIEMDSALRPRDIQARIRAGESPEAVAQAAQTSVDRIMAYAGPVLAERQHIADRAQRSSVRRRAGEAGAAGRTLGEAVTAQLRAHNIDPESVEWDSWRREDGRWVLTGEFTAIKRNGTARFTFDAPGNYVSLDNDDARWLVGESVSSSEGGDSPPTKASAPSSRDDLSQARQRRLSAVPEDELPLGDDAIELVSDHVDELPTGSPVEAFLDDEPGADETEVSEEAADAAALDDEPSDVEPDATEPEVSEPDPEPVHDPADHEPATRRPVKKSRGRASVPSWDEIMFGGGKPE